MAILDDFHEVASLAGGQTLRSPIVEDQQIGFHEGAEQTRVSPVTSGEFQFGEETRGAPVENGGVVTAGFLAEGTGKPEPALDPDPGSCRVHIDCVSR